MNGYDGLYDWLWLQLWLAKMVMDKDMFKCLFMSTLLEYMWIIFQLPLFMGWIPLKYKYFDNRKYESGNF